MNPERRVSRRFFLKAGATSAAALVAEPYLVNAENAGRVIESFLGDSVDCVSGPENRNPHYQADAIAVPSAGTIRTVNGSEPDESGKIRLEAAAIAYFRKIAPVIILLGAEKDAPGVTGEEKYLQQAFGKLTGNTARIPDEVIFTERNSINTATNMEELAKMAEGLRIKTVGVISNHSHEKRATLYACTRGLLAFPISAEELIANQGGNPPRHDWREELIEAIKRATVAFDPHGEISTLAKGIIK